MMHSPMVPPFAHTMEFDNYSRSTLNEGFSLQSMGSQDTLKQHEPSDDLPLSVPSTPPDEQDSPPPDGGLTAWLQVFVGFLLVFNGFGFATSFGIFQSYYSTTLGRPPSDISFVGSIQLSFLFFVGTPAGRAMDAGHFRALVIAGCLCQLTGVFTTSLASQYWQLFLAQGILQGIGNGLLFAPVVALISVYFAKKRSVALAVCACGAPIGGVVYPLIARQLTTDIGFPWTVRVMGFVMLFNSVAAVLLARPRMKPRKSGPLVEWSSFREPVYSLYTIGIFLVSWGLYFAYYYIAVFGRDIVGISSETSLTILLSMNAIGVFGRLIPAYIADRFFGPFSTLIPMVFACAVLLYSWAAVDSFGGLIPFVLFYGFSANAVQTLFPAALAGLTTDLTKMGVRVGMCFSVVGVACLTGPPIAGVLIRKADGKFWGAQVFGGTTMMLGTGFLVASRMLLARPTANK